MSKTIYINDTKEIKVNGIKAKQLSIIMNHYANLRKRASEDENISMALSGLMYIFNSAEKEKSLLNLMLPQVIATFYDEVIALIQQLQPTLTQEEIDDMEIATLVEILLAYIETTDIEQLTKVLGKLSTQFAHIIK